MASIKVLVGPEHITFDTDVDISVIDEHFILLLETIRKYKILTTPNINTIDLIRISDNIFTYQVVTNDNPARKYSQTWYFNDVSPYVEFNSTTSGKWKISELVANINLRDVIRSINTDLKISKLSCKWN